MADCDALRLGDRRRKSNSRPDTQKATGLYDDTARHYFDILTLHALLCLTINHWITVFELCSCNARLETTRGDSKRWRCIHQADACSIWTLCVRTHHPCPFSLACWGSHIRQIWMVFIAWFRLGLSNRSEEIPLADGKRLQSMVSNLFTAFALHRSFTSPTDISCSLQWSECEFIKFLIFALTDISVHPVLLLLTPRRMCTGIIHPVVYKSSPKSREFNCQALYTFNQLAGDAAVGLASVNLSIRTSV